MKRICSHYTFISPDNILPRAVVEQNDDKVITTIFSLSDGTESTHTLFYDGIISARIVSLAERLSARELDKIQERYNYIDLTSPLPNAVNTENPLLLDFRSSSLQEINNLIKKSVHFLSQFSIYDLIAGSVYFPMVEQGSDSGLVPQMKTDLIVWQGIDWENKKVTENTRIIQVT